MFSKEMLEHLAQIDIRDVDKNELVDINDVVIRKDLPPRERVLDYLRQIKNPYCYNDHGVTVKISFAGKCSLEEALAKCFWNVSAVDGSIDTNSEFFEKTG